MTELVQTVTGAGSVDFIPTSPRKPEINEKKFSKIIRTLYTAFVHKKGLYGQVSMETHAPQLKYYPGCPALRREIKQDKKQQDSLVDMPTEEEVADMIHDFFERNNSTPDVRIGLGSGLELTATMMSGAQSKQFAKLKALEKEVREFHRAEEDTNARTKVLERFTPKHRRWLWFATLTDRRERSDLVYRAHCRIYADHPELYSEQVIGISPDVFREMIRKKSYKIGSPYQSAEYWIACAKTLFEEFDGDPVLLLKHAGWSVREVYEWKQEEKKKRGYDPIPGWGRKLISLYFLYLAELGYPMPDDVFPADVHAQAILLQTGCINFAGKETVYTADLAEMARKTVTDVCREKNYDVILYGHASWLLGSQLCVKCAGNREVPYLCPIYKECKGRVDTSSYFAKGIWRKDGQVMTKGGLRPKFGMPTDVSPRERTRKNTKVIPITPLYD